ncbi:MAG: NAD(P)H-dependent oxidoreductase [Fimbriimonadaceae bacterium]
MPTVLAVSGSLRTGSYNTSLLRVAVRMLEEKGATVTGFDFRAHPLPIYDGDLEKNEGFPESVLLIKGAVRDADAVLFAGPEYNSGPTPLLKNAIDWVSRRNADRGANNEFDGKVCAVVSASPGAFGGVRAQYVYRNALSFLGAFVLPDLVTLPNAADAFDAEGRLLNERTGKALDSLTTKLLEVSSRLRGI